jgi:hypothetical protein
MVRRVVERVGCRCVPRGAVRYSALGQFGQDVPPHLSCWGVLSVVAGDVDHRADLQSELRRLRRAATGVRLSSPLVQAIEGWSF